MSTSNANTNEGLASKANSKKGVYHFDSVKKRQDSQYFDRDMMGRGSVPFLRVLRSIILVGSYEVVPTVVEVPWYSIINNILLLYLWYYLLYILEYLCYSGTCRYYLDLVHIILRYSILF
jgi:hypothetical protein